MGGIGQNIIREMLEEGTVKCPDIETREEAQVRRRVEGNAPAGYWDDGPLDPAPLSKYDSVREKMRKEVHDESAVMLEAALFDINTLRKMLDSAREDNNELRHEVARLQIKEMEAGQAEHVTETHRMFALALTHLCREHHFSLSPLDDGSIQIDAGREEEFSAEWDGVAVVLVSS